MSSPAPPGCRPILTLGLRATGSHLTIIREERPEDHDDVHRVTKAAFGRPGEAGLVESLRAAGQSVLSLVTVTKGKLVGHIFFTHVSIESTSSKSTPLALGPMAVVPEFQNQGIGPVLVRRGLEWCLHSGFSRRGCPWTLELLSPLWLY